MATFILLDQGRLGHPEAGEAQPVYTSGPPAGAVPQVES